MNELSLFTGAGGGLLGTKLLDWKHIGYVEINEYCQKAIRQRIDDGILDEAPIFTDVREFVESGFADQYQGFADVVTAGFPCQPFSVAGKRKAENDERNMWPATIDTIRRVRPKYALLENVPGLISSGYFGRILGDLAESGYLFRWEVLGGFEVGNISNGERLWIVATEANSAMLEGVDIQENRIPNQEESFRRQFTRAVCKMLSQDDYTRIKRNPHDVARGMEQFKAVGNGQNPFLVKRAWGLLSNAN